MELKEQSYGKSRVRLVKVTRHTGSHDLAELTINVKLEGGFDAAYTAGDNSSIVATDTMKNIVYVLARQHPVDPIEPFAQRLGEAILSEYSPVATVRTEILEHPWSRLDPFAFQQAGGERRTARVVSTRESVTVESGVENLVMLKTTKSAFTGYIKDRYTTLKETNDRIFATAVEASWRYSTIAVDFNTNWHACRLAMIETFAAHASKSVQETLYAMGGAVLGVDSAISQIRLSMPNKHCLLVDLAPFGLENPNEIFVPVDEPHGLIEATIEAPRK